MILKHILVRSLLKDILELYEVDKKKTWGVLKKDFHFFRKLKRDCSHHNLKSFQKLTSGVKQAQMLEF